MFSSAITQHNDVTKQNTNKYATNYTVPQCNNKCKRSMYRVFGLVRNTAQVIIFILRFIITRMQLAIRGHSQPTITPVISLSFV